MKNPQLTPHLMDIKHHKEFETIAGRTADGIPASPLVRPTLSPERRTETISGGFSRTC
jgi:hypothetical protein